jgi:hypothetical protein
VRSTYVALLGSCVFVGAIVGAGCAQGVDIAPRFGPGDAAGAEEASAEGSPGGGHDASSGDASTSDASASDAAASDAVASDAVATDAASGIDAPATGSDGATGGDATGLDPGLVLPDPSGTPCADPGQTQCSGAEICRISSTTGGTCEGCTGCGNLHAPCTADSDCDILFQCYEGYCDSLCQLSTPQTCGVPTDCIQVGNATTGVCKYP